MNQVPVHVGIDVAKNELEVDAFDQKAPSVPNTSRGISSLVRRIKAFGQPVVLCCEASGGYEKMLINRMLQEGIPIALVNALWVKHFALSRGLLAKTDRIDAKTLSAYSVQNNPRLAEKPPVWMERLRSLLTRKEELTNMIKQETCRLNTYQDSQIARLIRTHIRSLRRQVDTLKREIRDLEKIHAELKVMRLRYSQVQSIGEDIAYHFIAFMPELGLISDKQAAALVGVAPYNDDSGKKAGVRMIKRGRKRVRDKLYMGAVSAITCNPTLKETYQRLVSAGKKPKVALVAVMRKQVVLLNRMAADPDFQLS